MRGKVMRVRRMWITALVGAVLLTSTVSAREPKSPEFKVHDGLFLFEKVESVELTKKEVVAHAAAFIAEKFKLSKSVIELRDDELGKIVGDVVLANPNAKMARPSPTTS